MTSQVIVSLRCNWCSRQLPPTDLMAWSTNQLMCRRCYEAHYKALQVLGGAVPEGCAFCGVPFAFLNSLPTGPTTRMYVVPVDGIYAVACATCKDEYCRKRKDLYSGTRFGHEELKF